MSSSARTKSDCGIVRPSAFAVLRLITKSNFVGCCTGSSAGLAPLRILVHVAGTTPQQVGVVGPIRHQPPGRHVILEQVDRWKASLYRQLRNSCAMNASQGVSIHLNRIRAGASRGFEGPLQLIEGLGLQDLLLHLKLFSGGHRLGETRTIHAVGGVYKDGHAGRAGNCLVEQLELFLCESLRH
jgi:hypothetical protein